MEIKFSSIELVLRYLAMLDEEKEYFKNEPDKVEEINFQIKQFDTIFEDLNCLEELKQRWNKEEWCQGIPLSAESLKSLFNYNKELFEENLALDKKKLELEKENQILKQSVKDTYDTSQEIIADLKEELDTFKLAFYTLWKCCNKSDIPSDIDSDFYLEFKCGYESLCIPVTEQEIESIKKATELLDINVKEVLG